MIRNSAILRRKEDHILIDKIRIVIIGSGVLPETIVCEEEDYQFVTSFPMSGIIKNDVLVIVTPNTSSFDDLCVSLNNMDGISENYLTKSYDLPEVIETNWRISTSYEEGVLSLRIPKLNQSTI